IPVSEVLAALGGRLFDSGFCDKHKGVARLCTHLPDCSIRPVLREVQEAVDRVLSVLTLKSLLASEQQVSVSVSPRAITLPGPPPPPPPLPPSAGRRARAQSFSLGRCAAGAPEKILRLTPDAEVDPPQSRSARNRGFTL